MKRIHEIQMQLCVPKTERGQNYQYRTLQQTMQALLPLLSAKGLWMALPVEFQPAGTGAQYVVAHCVVRDIKTGMVVAETTYPTMDSNPMIKGGQGTGAACTYAKKGAIDSLFLLDVNDPNAIDLDDQEGLRREAEKDAPKKAESNAEPAFVKGRKELTEAQASDPNTVEYYALKWDPKKCPSIAIFVRDYTHVNATNKAIQILANNITDYKVSNNLA